MRVLVDSTFPKSSEGPQAGGHHIDRYEAALISDKELIEHADRQGYEVIVLLGTDALADEHMSRTPESRRVLIAVTSSDDPDEAEIALKSNITSLAAHVGSSSLVVVRKGSVHKQA